MASLAPVIRQRFFDANGVPLAGGKLYSYSAGTSTPKATYTDSSGFAANTNPVVLNANGEANVWISGNYKFVLADSSDVVQWTVDNVTSVDSISSTSTSSGVINLISNGDGETSTSTPLFQAYADGAATRPVDGIGGGPSVLSSVTTSSPLSGAVSQSLGKTAVNSQGQGWSVDFQVPIAYRGRKLEISFDYLISSGTFNPGLATSEGDVICCVYDVTNNLVQDPSTVRLSSSSGSQSQHFKAEFITSTTSTTYRFILHIASTSTSAYSLQVDNVRVTPVDTLDSSVEVTNLGLIASVAANALTIDVKNKLGSNPSNQSPCQIGMRSSTPGSGLYNQRIVNYPVTLTVPTGATLGTPSIFASYLFVYLIDNAGVVELAISSRLFSEDQLISTTAISGSSTSALIMYSASARSNVPFRLVGRMISSQATAGTWAANPSSVAVGDYGMLALMQPTQQKFTSGSGTYTVPPNVKYLRVQMVGGGAGGAGSGNSGNGNSSTAGNTTFGTSLLTANGGGATTSGTFGGNGGSASIAAPAFGISISGANGGAAGFSGTTGGIQLPGGTGGASVFGGAGGAGPGSGTNGTSGFAAQTNSGSGGGGAGAGTTASSSSGAGGGAGGYVDAIIPGPLATSYPYSVGLASSGGSAGTNGSAGAAGAAGIIVVTEYYY